MHGTDSSRRTSKLMHRHTILCSPRNIIPASPSMLLLDHYDILVHEFPLQSVEWPHPGY